LNRLAMVMSGPTTDYGSTNFGGTTPGYVAETLNATNTTCAGDGSCVHQFAATIPANARGTFTVGVEARRTAILLPGTTNR